MDTYCSPETLPEDYESIPGFFSVLEQGERHHRERMDEWLDYVAQAIVNARSIIAGDVIVGGEAAQHLEDSDIEDLKARVIARSPVRHRPFQSAQELLRRRPEHHRCRIAIRRELSRRYLWCCGTRLISA